ncbi:hypothetical protein ASPZODRAFT_127644 [Penicilliopsis zonata CBS 506.65]|uniref:Uncharacterized protein n=1 Tax=Penicilliopsis zonata CBS 506.65 TaxID=1073090 RepID=A0A1L9SWS8_9EURO|nr:hypothetical protein ASPZODRAFT_127644 [Penicilliopsis zonata CBS 506.65]OJJ51551.1 hypothetical protein ASPZODRAFT_127644 [Penicilliopsis zonata CBS 506.65]
MVAITPIQRGFDCGSWIVDRKRNRSNTIDATRDERKGPNLVMAWYSILPSQFLFVESWAARIFILLGLITMGPWAALVIFDVVLYVYRMVMYEIPVIGGRARGRQRPRAPSLAETTAQRSPSSADFKTRPTGQGGGLKMRHSQSE